MVIADILIFGGACSSSDENIVFRFQVKSNQNDFLFVPSTSQFYTIVIDNNNINGHEVNFKIEQYCK